jgi:PRTRC genetic system ThiF family protein
MSRKRRAARPVAASRAVTVPPPQAAGPETEALSVTGVSYVIDSRPGGARLEYAGLHAGGRRDATVVLVGCGGTGSFLAEALCRLLIGRAAELYLVDLDRVEAHNVGRQAFGPEDVGRFKAQVLAERLSQRFGREVGYSVLPYDRELHGAVFGTRAQLNLLVGCVDNAAARRAIAATLERSHYARPPIWWLDTGNGRNSGQVLLGNVVRSEELRGAFLPHEARCVALPAPSLQRPDLLTAPPAPVQPTTPLDCAQAVAAGEQGPTINQAVAAIAAGVVAKLLEGTCRWAAAYFDLDEGTLRALPPDPRSVAALAGLHLNAVAPVPHHGAPPAAAAA